ncbi:MAG TPA: SBBP repeat-containing protein, partial [Candidatus Kapabacteria bacterium]|nr:SBBP repeat-containing protein [Candidatus Kapabacteria bacterium]
RAAAIAVDGSGNVYVCGNTSSFNAIATAGAHQTTFNKTFVVKFTSNGVRLWGTYYSGNDSQANTTNKSITLRDIAVDGSGNLYVTGMVREIGLFINGQITYPSTSNSIATIGAHQTTFGGGGYDDAFIVKFNTNGILLWGTYYGGSEFDSGESVAVDGSGNVYVTGDTKSNNAIATTGAHQTTFGGGDNRDAFIAKFKQGNDIIWLKAEDAGTVDNSAVSQWQDQSGNDDNAVQNNSGSRPFYRNNGNDNINGHPVVGFSFGRALSMAGREQVNGGNAKTFFVVFRTGSNTLSRQVLLDLGGLSSGFNMYIQNSRLYAGAWDNNSWWVNTIVTSNRTYLAQFVYDGTRLRLSLSTPGLGTTINESNFSDNFITALITGNGIGSAFQQTRYHNGINIATGHSDFFT